MRARLCRAALISPRLAPIAGGAIVTLIFDWPWPKVSVRCPCESENLLPLRRLPFDPTTVMPLRRLRDLREKLRPCGRLSRTLESPGAAVPWLTVKTSFGLPLLTPLSPPPDCAGGPSTFQANVEPPEVPGRACSNAWTVTL